MPRNRLSALQIWVLVLLVTQTLFVALPGIDLEIASWFYTPGEGFRLARFGGLEALRQGLWMLGMAVFFVALLGLVLALCGRRLWDGAAGFWGRAVLMVMLGPGFLVNVVFKAYWGRARPRDIAEFGGDKVFTPAFQISDQCGTNCSFVSGEGALAVACGLIVGLAVWQRMKGRRRVLWLTGVVALSAFAALLRVAFGAHFLSDTVFAALFCLGIWLGLGRIPALGQAVAPDPGRAVAQARAVASRTVALLRGAGARVATLSARRDRKKG